MSCHVRCAPGWMKTATFNSTQVFGLVFLGSEVDQEAIRPHLLSAKGRSFRNIRAADAAARPGHDGNFFRKRMVLGARRHDHGPFAMLTPPPR